MLADRFLETYATESLKAMARRRGMTEATGANKADLIAFLAPRLFSRDANRRLVQSLSRRQRRLLGALKARGCRASTIALAAAVDGDPAEVRGDLRELIELGLLLYPAEGRPLKYRIGECERVWMDRTSADAVDPLEAHGPLPKLLADEPERRVEGALGLFLADLVLMTVALEREDIVFSSAAKQSPGPDRSGWARLGRDLLLPDSPDAAPGSGRSRFLYLLLEELGLVNVRAGRLVPDDRAGDFFHRSRADQARRIFQAYKKTRGWNELQRVSQLVRCALPDRDGPTHFPPAGRVVRARARVLAALRRFDPQRWYAFSSLCREIQATHPQFLIRRLGDETGGHLYRGIGERGRGDTTHPLDLTSDWLRVEGRFIAQVLLEPLSWIGGVDLGWQSTPANGPGTQDSPTFDTFRVRPEGAYLLGVSDALPGQSPRSGDLMVQPDFDILSLSGETDTGLIHDLSRFADFTGGDRVVRFSLSRPAAQRGFHDGWTAERVVERLARETVTDVPQNVIASVQAWEAAYRRFRIVRGVHLLEDPQGLWDGDGRTVADGLVRLPNRDLADLLRRMRDRGTAVRRFDYESRPGHALVLGPGLRMTRTPRGDDWVTDALLRRCARPLTGEHEVWVLDRKAVAASGEDGLTPEDLQEMIEARSASTSAEIRIALRAWSGNGAAASVGQTTVFSCGDEKLLRMLLRVSAVRDCLEAKLAPGLFSVVRGRTGALRERLGDLGVDTSARVAAGERLANEPQQHARGRGGNGGRNVLVWSRRSRDSARTPSLARLVQLAIEERRRMRMLYAPDGLSPAEREVTPLGLQGPDLVAYCHRQSAQRTYRMDRILSIEVLPALR